MANNICYQIKTAMNMKKLLFVAIVMMTYVAGLQAQDFSTLINEAERNFYRGDYATAAQQYERAFLTGRASEIHYYAAACAYAKAGNTDQALEKVNLAIEQGWMAVDPLLHDPDLESLRGMAGWDNTIRDLRQRVASFKASLNNELVRQLAAIEERDQRYRKEIRAMEATTKKNPHRREELEQLQADLDAQNIAEVRSIISEYGYPGKQLVGDKCEVAFMVIQNAELETQKEYLPVLEMAADNGDIPWFSLMRMMDRIDTQEGRLQLYGTTVYRRDWGNQIDVYRAGDDVDTRVAAGLPPLEGESRWDVELQKPQSAAQRR